jgi:cobalt-zinc-cadmium resistance protein CzcA
MRVNKVEVTKLNNSALQAASISIEQQDILKATAFDFAQTEIYYNYDEANIAPNDAALKTWGISQGFRFPTVYASRLKVQKQKLEVEKHRYTMAELLLEKQISQAYNQILSFNEIIDQYDKMDSLYEVFASAAERKYMTGEANQLESLTAHAKWREITLELERMEQLKVAALAKMKRHIQADSLEPIIGYPERLELEVPNISNHVGKQYFEELRVLSEKQTRAQAANWLPGIHLEYFRANNDAPNNELLPGFQVGISIPIWFGNQKSMVRSSRLEQERVALEADDYDHQLNAAMQQSIATLTHYGKALDLWDQEWEELSRKLRTTGRQSYKSGEIDFLEYILILERATNLAIGHLQNQMWYNDTILEIKYLIN